MKIDHVNIVVADLERAAHFYETVFGLSRGFAATLEGAWIETVTGLQNARAECLFLHAPDGQTRLELICYENSSGRIALNSQPNTLGLRHLAFEVEDIHQTLEKARNLGIEPISAPVEVPFRVGNLGAKRLAYFHDFDGTLLEAASYDSR